ncbi:MAG: hypothetical protein H6722_19405 [Sandaracinus sp.]|nr:hypothetical protein [Myxococcales bacterium]MCB9614611.1 hypothetical protein [Sandaracinus sp.]MCB9620385.1 hypothetical protein [Sandaracinus sp.]
MLRRGLLATLAVAGVGSSALVGSQAPTENPENPTTPAPANRYAVLENTDVAEAETHELSAEDRVRRAGVVARVDGVAITVGEIEDLLVPGASDDDVRAALDASIRRVRITREAERIGLNAHPDVLSAERRALVRVLVERDFSTADAPVGAGDEARLDALATRLRAEHVTDVELAPLYPLALDPRTRAMRGQPPPPAVPTPAELPVGATTGTVESEAFELRGEP